MSRKNIDINSIPLPKADTIPLPDDSKKSSKKIKRLAMPSDSDFLIPLPKTDPVLAKKEEPQLIIQSSKDGSRSVMTPTKVDEKHNDSRSNKKQKKRHKEKKHKHKHKRKEKDREKSPHSKERKVLQSKELLQREIMSYRANSGEIGSKGKSGEMSQTIVDELFKDFIATKMHQIESEYKSSKHSSLERKEDVANSVEEMNRLLDDELDSISQNTISPIRKIDKLPETKKKGEKIKDSIKVLEKAIGSAGKISEKIPESSQMVVESRKQIDKVKDVSDVGKNMLNPVKILEKKQEVVKVVKDVEKQTEEQKSAKIVPEKKKSSKWDVKERKEPDTKNDTNGGITSKVDTEIVTKSTVQKQEPESSLMLKDTKENGEKLLDSSLASFKDQTKQPENSLTVSVEADKSAFQPIKMDVENEKNSSEPNDFNEIDKSKSVKKQMAFKISQISAEIIAAGNPEKKVKKSKGLEEGEVLSSNDEGSCDDDDDNDEDEDDDSESDDLDDPSETGSLSDSDKDANKDSKKSKSKKKKKKKNKKRKKKKKHKSSKEKEKDKEGSSEKKSKRKHSSRSRSKTPCKKSKKSYSRSPERRSSKRSRSSSRDRSRDRNIDPEFDAYTYSDKYRYRERDRDRDIRDSRDYKDRDRRHGRRRSRSRSRDRSRDRDRERRRSRSKSRNRDKADSDLRVKIDKAKLREIAIKNALAMAKAGDGSVPQIDLATIKAGGKSVEELTNFCKRISSKEKPRGRHESSSDSESESSGKSEEEDDSLIHHPFKLKEIQSAIVMNIRNAKPLPILTAQEKITQNSQLRLQFPVSSGSTHRIKEHEWVPVPKTTAPPAPSIASTTQSAAVLGDKASETTAVSTSVPTTPTATTTTTGDGAVFAIPAPPPPPPSLMPSNISTAVDTAAAISAASCKPQPKYGVEHPIKPKQDDSIFPVMPSLPLDISSIIAERVHAVRQLASNPHDLDAMSKIAKAQEKASQWAQSKFLPGQFIGSTGAQILSQEELMGPDKKRQAWVKKDQIAKAAPLRGGIGMALLQKMGWKQGEGLGKNKEGSLEPLALDFKTDRKGLTSIGENKNKKQPHAPVVRDLSGKHPVSALVELCNKRRWGPPDFHLIQESGPDHQKAFQFKVLVNGTEFMPTTASNSKKGAKYNAASVCLQELGLIPRDSPLMS